MSKLGERLIDAAKECRTVPVLDSRSCTCHPDDAPVPCTRKYATSECQVASKVREARHNFLYGS